MNALKDTALSVLDLARVPEGKPLATAFQQSKELARHVEKLGFKRFWLAEHHNIEGIASAATSVLIGYIAENTTKIRIGSGGIMLPNHAPLIIAEQFGTLATLYPDRIDLGLGRAPGTDQTTMRALRRDLTGKGADFSELIEELLSYFSPARENQPVKAIPGIGIDLPIYILGSSLYSAQLAARIGRPYAFAGHFAPRMMMQAFDVYRSTFQASKVLDKPYVMLGVPVVASETDAKAAFLATSIQQSFLNLIRGQRRLNLPPVPDMDSLWSEQEKAYVQSMLGLLIVGGPKKIQEDLNDLITQTGADELIITSDTYEHDDRLKSFEIIMSAKSELNL